MKKNLLFLVALLLGRMLLPAQNLTAFTPQYVGFTWVNYSCTTPFPGLGCSDKENRVKVEVPPWIIAGGWRSYYLIDGHGTSIASSPLSLVTSDNIDFSKNGEGPFRVTTKSECPGGEPWRLNYYCAYSAQKIYHPTAGWVSLGFVEGENRVQVGAGHERVECDYEGWDGHSSYLCAAWIPNTEATSWGQAYFSNDMGPIVWPSTGYFLPDGTKSSGGCGNNATIQADDGYLYVFYKDQSYQGISQEPGRQPGIKVARAPISDALNRHAYKSFYEDATGIHWNQSLPADLDKPYINAYIYGSQGPLASNILALPNESGRDYTRFSVAKVTGRNYYLGVGSFHLNGKLYMTLKYSYDLVHWLGDKVINEATSWDSSNFNYPIFLSADGWSNTQIAENSFYVLGTRADAIGNAVHKMHVYIPAPPPPPKEKICEDMHGNKYICPKECYDHKGRVIPCPVEVRIATTPSATAEELDNTKERAPFVSPNPGPGVFRLSYTLTSQAKTQLNVRDLMGRQVQTAAAVSRTPGTYTETVNISSHAKGVYLLELLVNGKKQTFKVIYQ
jgi:hypothetical protein